MIRFRRLFDIVTDHDRQQADEIRTMFNQAFPEEMRAAERYLDYISGRRAEFETIVLIAEDQTGAVLGFSLSMYFPEMKYAYLLYIASTPARPARGIGGALYEALRELLVKKKTKALFLDAGPDDPKRLKDPAGLAVNRRRLKFYERYDIRPIVNTAYDEIGNPKNDGYIVSLLYDPLGRNRPLPRAAAKAFLERMYKAQYGQTSADPYVARVLASLKDNPVLIRPPKYIKSEPFITRQRPWLKPLKLIVSERHTIHHLTERGYVERPVRIDAVLKGLATIPYERIPTRRFPDSVLTEIHDPKLVSYLKAISKKLSPKQILYPEVFPIRRADRMPRELESRAGYFCIDTFTPLTSNIWNAARSAANTALTGAELLVHGARLAYALCRPPGHHAERSVYGGFCYLNNTAIATQRLSKLGKVAVLDIDYHHGNGTQEIFYLRNNVFTLSIHGSPTFSYPHFAGFEDEKGEGEGRGFNRNFPLRRGTDERRYLDVLNEAIATIQRYKPTWLVVALGFDIMRGDPTGSFTLDPKAMREIGTRLGKINLPTLVVQEGGYALTNIRQGSEAFFGGLTGTWY